MSETVKHTPGPWRLSGNRPCDIYQTGGRYIGTTYGHYDSDTLPHIFATDKENARLMAAAPELLEAARHAMQTMVAGYPADDSKAARHFRKAIDMLDEAIMKATGEDE